MLNYYQKSSKILLALLSLLLVISIESRAERLSIPNKTAPTTWVVPTIEDQDFTIVEGSATGTVVGTVRATATENIASFTIASATFSGADDSPDGDSQDDPQYDPATVFAISSDGVLTVNNPKYLLEVLGPIQLEITVANNQGEEATAIITVAITDIEVSITNTIQLNWSTLANHPQGHSEATGGIVNNNLFVFSGFTSNFAPKEEVFGYDIAADNWSQLQDMPPMANNSGAGGATHMGWTTDGTDIYVAAGYAADISGNAQQFASQRVYRYVIADDSYEELPSLPIERSAGALEFIDEKLYYVAGTNRSRDEDQSDLLVLDLNNLNGGWATLSQMPNPRNHVGSTVYNGQLYIFGGQKEHDEELVPQNDVHRYDPATDSWTHITDMPMPFNHIHASVFTAGEFIFSIGGQIAHNAGAYAEVYAYKPESGAWYQFTNLPARRFSTVCGTADNKIFVSGGNNSRATYVANIPEAVLSVEKVLAEKRTSDFTIVPNPAREQIQIHTMLEGKAIDLVELYDLNGRLLKSYSGEELSGSKVTKLSLNGLETGSYVLRITDKRNQVTTEKILIK